MKKRYIDLKLELCPHGHVYCTCKSRFKTELRKLIELDAIEMRSSLKFNNQ
jgi:hypothetical protein